MNLSTLQAITTVDELAASLGTNYDQLAWLLYRGGAKARYRRFEIEKKSGGKRKILAPRRRLKLLQRQVLVALTEAYRPSASAHGFVPDRSIRSNAAPHVGASALLNLDLEDFFPSISFYRVRGIFAGPPFSVPYEVATVLAELACFEGSLPQGAPTSPMLSNFACVVLDRELKEFVRRHGGQYSRYCDDVSISFSRALKFVPRTMWYSSPSGVVLGDRLVEIITGQGFRINGSKLRTSASNRRMSVTGLVVNSKVNLCRPWIRRLSSWLHAAERFGLPAAGQVLLGVSDADAAGKKLYRKLEGCIAHVHNIRGSGDFLHAKLAKRFGRLGPRAIRSFLAVHDSSTARRAIFVLESESMTSQGTAFLVDGIGLVSCAHVVLDRGGAASDVLAFRSSSPNEKNPVRVRWFDEEADLAVLEFIAATPELLDTRFVGAGSQPTARDTVHTLGFPNYRTGQTPFEVTTQVAAIHGPRFELATRIAPGHSGGPVLDVQYRVVGVAAKGATEVSKNEAIFFSALIRGR